ncbi:unnamed protein product [Cuscuta campestris]|uniref:Glycosyltransferase n=1 Tax=Cuscuta campestris TaxID=132261 RepID=A0A484NGX1_9ASTE|nr:unnamed protein product [Cuscuta campestris]
MAAAEQGSGDADHRRRGVAVLVPYPFQGHLTPMLQLGSVLHNRGFSILIAHTQFNSPNPKNHPNFLFHALSDGGLSSSRGGSIPPEKFFATMQENCRASLEKFLARRLEKQHGKDDEEMIKCVIYDNNMFFAREVAARLDIPSIVLRPHCAAILQHIALALTHGSGEDDKPQDESWTFQRDAKSLQYLQNLYDAYPSVACIWNTADCLDHSVLAQQPHQRPDATKTPFFAIGPLHKLAPPDFSSSCSLHEEDSACLAWLDTHPPRSVVYVSCGSLPLDGGKEVTEMAWGLANCDHPFLWALLPSSSQGTVEDLMPEGFREKVGERGKLVRWAPQKAVLGHPSVAVYLTHAGWGSAMESICGGVPMICRPIYADQFVNSQHLSREVKVGVELEEGAERGGVERAIRKVMGKEGEEVRERVAELKREIDDAVGEGGSSRRALDELVHFIDDALIPSSPLPLPT